METKTYLIILALVSSGSYLIGYTNRRVELREVVKEVVVEKEAKTKIVTEWRDRIVTKEKIIRPDGTTEERTIAESATLRNELQIKEKEIASLRAKQKQEVAAPKLPMISAGIQIPLKYSELLPKGMECCLDVSMSVGTRLLGPLWVEGGFRPRDKTVSVGVRYEF